VKLFNNPGSKELDKIIQKNWKPDSTFLHHTGHMFGIGCRLSSKAGLERINRLKQRTDKTGYIVLIHDIDWLYQQNVEIPASLHLILSQYWPGNLTVIIPVDNPIFENVVYNGKVAFRVPYDKLLRDTIERLGEPIISTSINLSGVQPATDLDDIQKRFENWFDLGILSGKTQTSEPSTIVEYVDKDLDGRPVPPQLKCIRESSIPFYLIKQSFTNPIILFVCMGNICRSPIAEYLFNHYSKERNLSFTAKSVGLMDSGSPISLNSLELLAEKNINATEHTSRKVNPEILAESWLVLTMEEYHRNVIRMHFPEAAHKIFTLKEFTGDKGDVEDPYGSSLDNYRITFDQIETSVRKLIDILEKQNLA
jgi:tRNA threonylcarbamoyl adenosine modification protein (Sua5/YciO/YrdC/YwlC family)